MSKSATDKTAELAEVDFDKTDASDIFCHKRIFFWKQEKSALAGQIAVIRGKAYVGLSKFWRIPDWKAERWAPGKKGHLYLTLEQWRLLIGSAPKISAAADALNNLLESKYLMHLESNVCCSHAFVSNFYP